MLVVAIVAGGAVVYYVGFNNFPGSTQPSQSESCDTAPQGSKLFIKTTMNDGTTPVTNVTIDATPVETCNGVNTTITIVSHPTTNASGIAVLDASYDTFYDLTVHYNNQSYPFTASVTNSMATCASLSIPSGNLNVASC